MLSGAGTGDGTHTFIATLDASISEVVGGFSTGALAGRNSLSIGIGDPVRNGDGIVVTTTLCITSVSPNDFGVP